MKRTSFMRIVSLLLALVLIFQMTPLQAFATENEELSDATDAIVYEGDGLPETNASAPDVYIEGEVTELRTEYEKHYRLTDGSFMAVQYQVPVHYQDDGEWVDIDNSLQAVSLFSGDQVYQNANGDNIQAFATDLSDGTIMTMAKGDYAISMAVVPGNTALENASVSVMEESEEVMANNDLAATAQIITANEEELSEDAPWEVDDVVPDTLSSSVLYENVFPNVDIRYDTYSYNVKESIILKQMMDLDEYMYSFQLDLTGLTPELLDDGSILLLDDAGEAQYTIPAPYMWDNSDNYSDAVYYTLDAMGDSWLLTVHADEEWLEDSDRVYPVTIDPSLNVSGSNLKFTTAVQSGPASTTVAVNGQMSCGYSMSYGQLEGFAKLTSLPSLPIGSTIIEAKLHPSFAANWISASCRMDVRMLTQEVTDWDNFVPWNGGATPAAGTPMDFIYVSATEYDSIHPEIWDITPAMMQWYEDPSSNYGVKFTGDTGTEPPTASTWLRFDPVYSWVTINYRNYTGTESYYTYETQSAVRAGTGYVGDFSSALTVFKTDLSYPSTTIPFTLTHVFNSVLSEQELSDFDSEETFAPDYSMMKTGNGWQMSVQESVMQTYFNGMYYQIYRDSDGTLHYFNWDEGIYYKDEDGLGYTLSQYTGGIESSYTLEDQQGNLKFFYHNMLTYIKDANKNRICFLYNGEEYDEVYTNWYPTGTDDRLTKIIAINKDQDQEPAIICTFAYDENNRLEAITDYANRTTRFTYTDGNLTTVTHPDDTTAQYTYNDDGQLICMYDAEAQYGIEYGYDGNKVSTISEFAITLNEDDVEVKTVGAQVRREKLGLQDVAYHYDGNDRLFGSADDIVNRYSFDYSGRTINAVTLDHQQKEILGVTAAAYRESSSSTPAANNRIEKTGQSGQNGVNLLSAGGMETRNNSNANNVWIGSNCITESTVRTGAKALKTVVSEGASNGYATVYQEVTLEAGKTYTFSAYVNAEDITSFGEDGGVYVAFMNSNTVLTSGDKITFATNDEINDGWQRVYATYDCTEGGTYRVAVVQENAYGTTYFDDLQLEEGKVPTNVNLIQNGTFNTTTEWDPDNADTDNFNFSASAGSGEFDLLHPNVYAVTGNPKEPLHSYQRVNIQKTCTDTTFLLSAWAKAASAADTVQSFDWAYGSDVDNDHTKRYFGLVAESWYTGSSGTMYCEYYYMPFSDNYDDWQFASCVIVPGRYYQNNAMTLNYIDVYVVYDNNFSTMYVDNVSLRQEPCATYTYDGNGSVTSVNATGSSSESVEYVGSTTKPSLVRTAGSGVYEYLYADPSTDYQPEYIVNYETEVYTNYLYDKYGNIKKTQIGSANALSAPKLITESTYSSDGSQLKSEINANGQTTSYEYGENRQVTKTTDNKGTYVKTEYDDENDRIEGSSVFKKDTPADGNPDAKVTYTYDKGLLSKITRYDKLSSNDVQSQYYNMSYDSFGNMTEVTVGSRVLARYNYGNLNNHLASMTYGNGDEISYTYDELDRVIAETWSAKDPNDGSTIVGDSYKYIYNSEGALAKKVDTAANRTVNYEYDSLGRLIRSSATDEDGITMLTEHLYDRANRLKEQSWQLRNDDGTYTTYTESYTYRSTDGAITKVDTAIGNDLHFSYDTALSRLIGQSNSIYNKSYTYRNISGSQTTNQIQTVSYAKGASNFSPFTLEYAYDELGNITSVSSDELSSQNATYTYDIQGQLTSETINGTEYHYEYDTYGNIRRAFIKNADDTETTIRSYTYGDDIWNDLLTRVGENAITYDEIGNPEDYYNGWHFTWAKGRQMTEARKDNLLIKYTYDLAGIRDSKKVGNVTYNYLTLSGKVVRQTWRDNNIDHTIDFAYDNSGNPYAFTYDGTTYYYVLNQQGDVIRIVDTTGTTVAEYQYNAWGKLMVEENTLTEIGRINPLRYRGYIYDPETGLYYVSSRYYDPEIGRFINADAVDLLGANGDFASLNLFAYCGNNPVARVDSNGHCWEAIAIGFVAGIVGQYIGDVIGNIQSGQTGVDIFTPTSSASDYLASGIGGAIAAIPGLNLVGTMAVGAVGSVVSDGFKGNINSWEDLGKSALKGGVANGIGYGVAKGMAALKVKQISNMPRSSRKVYLRDNFYCNSQANANVNLQTFANSSLAVNIGIVETQVAIFRSGVYSTVTSTFATLF